MKLNRFIWLVSYGPAQQNSSVIWNSIYLLPLVKRHKSSTQGMKLFIAKAIVRIGQSSSHPWASRSFPIIHALVCAPVLGLNAVGVSVWWRWKKNGCIKHCRLKRSCKFFKSSIKAACPRRRLQKSSTSRSRHYRTFWRCRQECNIPFKTNEGANAIGTGKVIFCDLRVRGELIFW